MLESKETIFLKKDSIYGSYDNKYFFELSYLKKKEFNSYDVFKHTAKK